MIIAVIWQRFLPYHIARLRNLRSRCEESGHELIPVEVATTDDSYKFASADKPTGPDRICCFPNASYHQHAPAEILKKVFDVLSSINPDIIFCPAAAFPEGMAAIRYRCSFGKRVVIMDDAWELTDIRGFLTKQIKRLIHKNVDAALIPAPSHRSYFNSLGFPDQNVVFGVDVVDNDYYSAKAAFARANEAKFRRSLALPENYFLFCGRFLQKKGIDTLIGAYNIYKQSCSEDIWHLILVGTGDNKEVFEKRCETQAEIHFAGPQYGDGLCYHYALSRALIVPSFFDQWGLVVNEGMASGLPVIVSSGCGAARTLVRNGENGWTFGPGDIRALAEAMVRMTHLGPEALKKMGANSTKIIQEWSPDRFSDGVFQAISKPRRGKAGIISNLVTSFWKGRVRTT